MTLYRTIVVGTDGSPTASAAVRHALELARLQEATLHVVSARRPEPALVGGPEGDGLVIDPAVAASYTEQVVAEVVVLAERAGVAAETHTPVGSAAGCLVETAAKVKADLVVVGSRGMRGARRVLGSTPNSVTHHAPCHVLVVHTC